MSEAKLVKLALGMLLKHIEISEVVSQKYKAVKAQDYQAAVVLREKEVELLKELPVYSQMKEVYDQLDVTGNIQLLDEALAGTTSPDETENILMNLAGSGVTVEDLTEGEVALLEKRFGENWKDELLLHVPMKSDFSVEGASRFGKKEIRYPLNAVSNLRDQQDNEKFEKGRQSLSETTLTPKFDLKSDGTTQLEDLPVNPSTERD